VSRAHLRGPSDVRTTFAQARRVWLDQAALNPSCDPLPEKGVVLRLSLVDWEELSADLFRVNEEAERIQQLALLHQPDQNGLPELC
jgi:hypothetical protein